MEGARNRRKPQIFAENRRFSQKNHRKLQIGLCHLRSVTFSSARNWGNSGILRGIKWGFVWRLAGIQWELLGDLVAMPGFFWKIWNWLEKAQGATRLGATGLRASEREICL